MRCAASAMISRAFLPARRSTSSGVPPGCAHQIGHLPPLRALGDPAVPDQRQGHLLRASASGPVLPLDLVAPAEMGPRHRRLPPSRCRVRSTKRSPGSTISGSRTETRVNVPFAPLEPSSRTSAITSDVPMNKCSDCRLRCACFSSSQSTAQSNMVVPSKTPFGQPQSRGRVDVLRPRRGSRLFAALHVPETPACHAPEVL